MTLVVVPAHRNEKLLDVIASLWRAAGYVDPLLRLRGSLTLYAKKR